MTERRHAWFMVSMWSVVFVICGLSVVRHGARGEPVAAIAWAAYGALVCIPLLVMRARRLAAIRRQEENRS